MRKTVFILIFLLFIVSYLKAQESDGILSWEDCILEAQKNNPDLIYAQESINQQKAAKAVTASGLFPQINSSLSASTASSATTNATTGTSKSRTTDSYSYGVTGSQLVFDGFKTINDVKGAAENINAARNNYRYASSTVRLNLRTAFVNLFRAQELIRVAEEIVKIRRDDLELITLRYQSGLEHRGAYLTAEADIAGANFGLDQAKREVELAQRQLTKEMGRKDFKPMQAKGDFVVKDIARSKPDLAALAKKHPSLLQAIAKKNAAVFGVKSAYGNFSPQLLGQAGANKTNSRWPPENNQWNLGLSLSLPIFEGGLRVAELSQAKAILNQAEATERSTRDSIIVNLEQAWVDLQDAVDTVDVRYKALIAAQERSKIAEAQYSIGFISFDNWIIIENDLVTAKKAYLDAQANALSAEAKWIQAKGETLEYAQ